MPGLQKPLQSAERDECKAEKTAYAQVLSFPTQKGELYLYLVAALQDNRNVRSVQDSRAGAMAYIQAGNCTCATEASGEADSKAQQIRIGLSFLMVF